MQIKKFEKITKNSTVKALRIINKVKKCKIAVSYSVLKNGLRWRNNKNQTKLFGCFSFKDSSFVERTLVIGKYKLSLILFS